MIKQVEIPTDRVGVDPVFQSIGKAVNMLIEEHNTLLQAMVDFNVMGTDAWQTIMLEEKDPNV